MDPGIACGDFVQAALEFKRALHPGIPDIRNPTQRKGRNLGGLVDGSDQAGLISDLPGTVARPGAINSAQGPKPFL